MLMIGSLGQPSLSSIRWYAEGLCMLQDDDRYYEERVAAERELAKSAPNSEIAGIHEELARQYEALIQHPELRGILRSAG